MYCRIIGKYYLYLAKYESDIHLKTMEAQSELTKAKKIYSKTR
jgi:hypothetical protein